MSGFLSRSKAVEILFFGLFLAALAVVLFDLCPGTHHSQEERVRYIQTENFVRGGGIDIRYPGEDLGFAVDDLAVPFGYLGTREGKLHVIHPPFFSWVASLLQPLLGERVARVLPLAFLFLAAVALGWALGLLMEKGVLYYALIVLFAAGSPVLVQAPRFTEHTMALFLVACGLWALVRYFKVPSPAGSLFASALLFGLSCFLRPEFAFMLLSFVLAAGIVFACAGMWREAAIVAAGAALPLAGRTIHEVVLYGTFPGPLLALQISGLSLSAPRGLAFAGALAVSFLFANVIPKKLPSLRGMRFLFPAVFLSAAVLVTAARITVSELVVLFPAILFAFAGFGKEIDKMLEGKGSLGAILAGSIFLCLILGALVKEPGAAVVLSAYLPLVPFLVVYLGAGHKRIFAPPAAAGILVFMIVLSFFSNLQLWRGEFGTYIHGNLRGIEFIRSNTAKGDVVVFDQPAATGNMGPLFFERVFLVASGPEDMDRIIATLRARGVGHFYFWTLSAVHLATYGNPYGEGSHAVFPTGCGSCSGSCSTNSYLIRVGTAGRKSP